MHHFFIQFLGLGVVFISLIQDHYELSSTIYLFVFFVSVDKDLFKFFSFPCLSLSSSFLLMLYSIFHTGNTQLTWLFIRNQYHYTMDNTIMASLSIRAATKKCLHFIYILYIHCVIKFSFFLLQCNHQSHPSLNWPCTQYTTVVHHHSVLQPFPPAHSFLSMNIFILHSSKLWELESTLIYLHD